MPFYTRKSPRIPHYDYSIENYYFITLCTHDKKCFFGSVNALAPIGVIAKRHIEQIEAHYQNVILDKFVVMPNHIHMILCVNCSHKTNVEQVIGQFKSGVTREVRKLYPDIKVWQRSFHDHVIRSQADYERIWLYIDGNPQRWDKDCFYVE